VVKDDDEDDKAKRERWKAFLELSRQLREEDGAELQVPKREVRPSPFRVVP
jgi:hypothetical protein